MNTAKELLNSIAIQDQVETELKQQIEDSKGEIEQRRDQLAEEWKAFFDEAFPDEVLSLISKWCYREVTVNHCKIKVDCAYIVFGLKNSEGYVRKSISFNSTTRMIAGHVFRDEITKPDYAAKELADVRDVLNEIRNNLPDIYQYIARYRQRQVDETKKRMETIMNTKPETPKKKYKITVEIEE